MARPTKPGSADVSPIEGIAVLVVVVGGFALR
jgi:hypothetical protein